jgi:VanZ family protein
MIFIRFWKPALWLILIIAASLFPGNKMPSVPLFPHADKAVHIMMYFILSLLLVKPVIRSGVKKAGWWVILFCLLFGVAMELTQAFGTTSRSGSWWDQWANTTGSVLGTSTYLYLLRNTRFNRFL